MGPWVAGLGMLTEEEKFTVDCDGFWPNFNVVLTSDFGPAEAEEHLAGAVPHFRELRVLALEPAAEARPSAHAPPAPATHCILTP